MRGGVLRCVAVCYMAARRVACVVLRSDVMRCVVLCRGVVRCGELWCDGLGDGVARRGVSRGRATCCGALRCVAL